MVPLMDNDDLIHLHVKLPSALYERLETYWHAHRLPSRSVAVREALERLLDADDAQHAARGQPRQP